MAIRYRTEAFVLTKKDKGEADQIVLFYTKDFGKIRVLAKSIRKIQSKLRGGIGLFSLSKIEFIKGKNYKTLTDARSEDNFPKIKNDFKKLFIAQKISDILERLIKGEEEDSLIWPLLKDTFKKLEETSLKEDYYFLFYHYFAWNLLSLLGYKINLWHCAICQRRLEEGEIYFDPEEGLICRKCSQKEKNHERILGETVKILRILIEKNWRIIPRIKVSHFHQSYLDSFLKKYLLSLDI